MNFNHFSSLNLFESPQKLEKVVNALLILQNIDMLIV